MRVVVLVAAWALLVLSLLGVVGYWYAGRIPLTVALSAFSPFLLFAAVPALVCFACARQWAPTVLSAVIAVLFVVVQVPLYVAAAQPASGAPSYAVMTVNLKLGQADPAAVVRAVRDHDVAVLMVQELTESAQRGLLAAGVETALPFRKTEPAGGARGTGLWSRFPVAGVSYTNLSFNNVVVRATVPGYPARPTFVALHVGGPIPDTANWRHDLMRLPAILRGLPAEAPVLVGGDFNATRSVPGFRDLLVGGYADAADQAGAGLARTYPADSALPPLLGIDHILTRDAVARSALTVSIPGSDHRALVARVALDPERRDTR